MLLSLSSLFRHNVKTTEFSLRQKNEMVSWEDLSFPVGVICAQPPALPVPGVLVTPVLRPTWSCQE